MSFFTKLKNRLFRSSSKISEGLDAIVADGGEEENPLNDEDQNFYLKRVIDADL